MAAVVAGAELEELRAKITAQGELVKELKTNKAEVSEIKAQVAVLLSLKNQLPEDERPKPKEKKAKAKKNTDLADKKKARAAARYANANKKKDILTDNYGNLPLNKSKEKIKREWTHVKQLTPELAGKKVLIRGYMQQSKKMGKLAFCTLRQTCYTVQCFVNGDLPAMAKFTSQIPIESIIDVEGVVTGVKEGEEIHAATQSLVEVQVDKIFCVQPSEKPVFYPVDAARSADAKTKDGKDFVSVNLDTRLDNRYLDLRTPVSQAIFRVSSMVCGSFREFLSDNDFVEIQTPKLLGGQSEGGAEVFKTEYFGSPCCLAQSPQLHKQIAAACSGFERVFEIGPVFRAEDSNTNRHLCEFHGLDMEMAFKDHYHEVLDMFSDLFHHVFKCINQRCVEELKVIREHSKFADLVFEAPEGAPAVGTTSRTLLLTFPEAIAMLRAAGVDEEEAGDYEDFSTPVEKKLGELVKNKYGVDFYFLDKFPSEFRPFYTMPDPADPRLSNSYDFFIRGQEILSGAQRVHDPEILTKKVAEKGIEPESIAFYIDAFKYGAMPHGGGGVGLERVVMLFLGLANIRQAALFPRDPKRLVP